MFAVGKKPSAYLINARREFVWKRERPNPCGMGGRATRHRQSASASSADDREQFSLQRPCLADLSRLQRLYETGKGTPFIVALHGGSNGDALADIAGAWGCRSSGSALARAMACAARRPLIEPSITRCLVIVIDCLLSRVSRFLLLRGWGRASRPGTFGLRQWVTFEPERASRWHRIYVQPLPPCCFVAGAVQLAMVAPIQWAR